MAIRFSVVAVALLGLSACSGLVQASDIYIAQNATGQNNGKDCSDAYPYTFFNNSGNWGSGAPIGPGTTVHLCGTLTSALIVRQSGSTGQPITVLFESGARMSAPNWGSGSAAINGFGVSDIVVDGGTNGLIEATSNGTSLASSVDDTGVQLSNCSNCTIRNLTISNMYLRPNNPGDESGQNTGGIYVAGGNNVSIYNNTVHDTKWCIAYSFSSAFSSLDIHGNTSYHCDHGIAVESGSSGARLSGAAVYGNTIYDGANWDDSGNRNHHDGIHTWAVQSGTSISGLMIYDNYIYGNWGANSTAFIYVEANGGYPGQGAEDGSLAFNNILVDQTPSNITHYGCGLLCDHANASYAVNNTIIGTGASSGLGLGITGTNMTVENNIIGNISEAVLLQSGATFKAWDYNDYYNIGGSGWNGSSTFPRWQQVEGCDLHSSLSNPMLSASLMPTSNSSSISQAGLDLTESIALPELSLDKAGRKRPTPPTNWTMGAYQFTGNATALSAPTSLAVVVH